MNNNRVAEAVALFENIKNKGKVRPNTIMYSTIAKGYAQDKQVGFFLCYNEKPCSAKIKKLCFAFSWTMLCAFMKK